MAFSFFFFQSQHFTLLCIKVVNLFLRVSVFMVTLERQHNLLHFIFPVILRYTTVTTFFYLQIMFLISFQRFCSESRRDFGNQSTGNMTINRNTWHFYFQCAIGSLISLPLRLAPRVILPAIHSTYKMLGHRTGKAVEFHLVGNTPHGQDLNSGSLSVLKSRWGNFLHIGWQIPRMHSDHRDEFCQWNATTIPSPSPEKGNQI